MDPGWILAAVAMATAVVGLFAWAARSLWRVLSRTTRFLDDFFGEPEHDGLPPKPGVMARLANLELKVNQIGTEVHPNSGHSLRDEVQRTAATVQTVKRDVDTVKSQVRGLQATVDGIRRENGK